MPTGLQEQKKRGFEISLGLERRIRNKATKLVLLTLVLIFLALSAYKSVLRVSSNDPLAGLA